MSDSAYYDDFNYDNDDYDRDRDYGNSETYNFTDYEDLISISEYVDNLEINKISNIKIRHT